jgi:hypothetical protein
LKAFFLSADASCAVDVPAMDAANKNVTKNLLHNLVLVFVKYGCPFFSFLPKIKYFVKVKVTGSLLILCRLPVKLLNSENFLCVWQGIG